MAVLRSIGRSVGRRARSTSHHQSSLLFCRMLNHPSSSGFVAERNVMVRSLSTSWDGHGTDLLSDSLAHNYGAPKIVLQAHGRSGFDVSNTVRNLDPSDQDLLKTKGIVHMSGSILAFPSACYMWNVRHPQEISLDKLAPIRLLRPKLEYLFIGSSEPVPPKLLDQIRMELAVAEEDHHVVVEPMDVTNAMGTFNVLNGEDRMVAAALILPPNEV